MIIPEIIRPTRSPLNKPKPKLNQPLNRSAVLLSAILIFTAFVVAPFINPPKTQAWTDKVMPKCTSLSFGTFNWKDKIQEKLDQYEANNPNNVAPESWNLESAQAFILYQAPNDTDVRLDAVFSNLKLAEFYKDPADSKYKYQLGIEPSAYQNPSWSHYQWEINITSKTVTSVGLTPSFATRSATTPYPTHDIMCVYSARGFDYAPTYDGTIFDTDVPSQGGEPECALLDIPCKIQKLTQGIADTFTAVNNALMRFLAWLFVPESSEMQEHASNLTDLLNEKLGFLLYPLTFTVDIWQALNDDTNAWCTESSCSKNTGSFMGSNFNLDFFKLNDVIPSLFVFMQNAIRVITILGLIHLARMKFKEVTQK